MIDCMALLWSLFLLVISIASLMLDSITLFGPVWIWILHHDRLLVCSMKILSRCSFRRRTHLSVLRTGGGCDPQKQQRQAELTHIDDAHQITLAMALLIDILMTSESPVPPPLTVSWLWACPSRTWEYRG